MLFWVKFICLAGVSSSCALVAMCTGALIVFCSSEESPPTSIYSSTNTFFKVSLIGIQFTYNRPSETFFLFPEVLKCWCGTIATMFSQAPARDSQDLLFFPRGFSMVMTIACCPCHLVRVTSTLAVGKVAKIARRYLLMFSRCSTTHCDFPPNADDLLSIQSCCLANVLPAPRFPSSRPDTASFRSCLLLPPGFLGTREAGTCAGSRACFPSLSPRFFCSC